MARGNLTNETAALLVELVEEREAIAEEKAETMQAFTTRVRQNRQKAKAAGLNPKALDAVVADRLREKRRDEDGLHEEIERLRKHTG